MKRLVVRPYTRPWYRILHDRGDIKYLFDIEQLDFSVKVDPYNKVIHISNDRSPRYNRKEAHVGSGASDVRAVYTLPLAVAFCWAFFSKRDQSLNTTVGLLSAISVPTVIRLLSNANVFG